MRRKKHTDTTRSMTQTNSISLYPDDNFHLTLHPHARIAAVDVGSKTLGIALCSLDVQIPTPLTVIKRSKYSHDAQILKSLIKEWEIRGWVFGLPLNMDGTSGSRVQATKTIARNISRDTGLPYCFQDERLSSSAAEDRLIALAVKPSIRKNVIDAHAAQGILESYLFRLQREKI